MSKGVDVSSVEDVSSDGMVRLEQFDAPMANPCPADTVPLWYVGHDIVQANNTHRERLIPDILWEILQEVGRLTDRLQAPVPLLCR
jgi:hypothetical protein